MNMEQLEIAEEVFVIDDGFEPVVQRGVVTAVRVLEGQEYNEVDVQFGSDPFDADVATPRTLGCMSCQVIRVDADGYELANKLGFPKP